MTNIEKQKLWEQRLLAFKNSGLKGSDWCHENHYRYDAFKYWHNKLYGRITTRRRSPSTSNQKTSSNK